MRKKNKQTNKAKTYITNEDVVDAFENGAGFMIDAAKRLNVSVSVISRRCKEMREAGDMRATEYMQRSRREMVDIAESSLRKFLERINKLADDATADCMQKMLPCLKYILDTQGKDKGYVLRQEFTGSDGKQLFEALTEQELDSRIKMIETRLKCTDKKKQNEKEANER